LPVARALRAVAGRAARTAAAAGCALLRNLFLFLAHPLVKHGKGVVELSVDLAATIAAGHTGAAAPVLGPLPEPAGVPAVPGAARLSVLRMRHRPHRILHRRLASGLRPVPGCDPPALPCPAPPRPSVLPCRSAPPHRADAGAGGVV
jgi:hypothetical protein